MSRLLAIRSRNAVCSGVGNAQRITHHDKDIKPAINLANYAVSSTVSAR